MYRAETWAGYCPVGGVLVRLSRDSEERQSLQNPTALAVGVYQEVYAGKNMKHAFGGYTQILG